MPLLTIETAGEAVFGTCDCCGKTTRRVWGFVHADASAYASYFVQWSEGHVSEYGAAWDLIIGEWGDGTSADDRYAVRLRYRNDDEAFGFMVVDAEAGAYESLASHALLREDIIGRPLAKDVFAICDAIFLQDPRVARVFGGKPEI